jgi:hypothetical protein
MERYALDLAEAAGSDDVRVFGEQSYETGAGGKLTTDVAVLIGGDLLLFEIHARRVAALAAVTGGVAEVANEVSTLLVHKVDQLGGCISALLSGVAQLPGVDLNAVDRIWPFVVSASYLRQSEHLWSFIRSTKDPQKTASLEAPTVQPLQVLDIEAFEKLMGLLERGDDVPGLLVRKTSGEFRERDLAVWAAEDPQAPAELPRMKSLEERWERMADEIEKRRSQVQGTGDGAAG